MTESYRVAIATCGGAPDLDEDAYLLKASLDHVGVLHEVRIWDDPAVAWGSYDAVLVRSTWDYPLKHDAFLRWIEQCRDVLVNPADVLRWNTDKTYLQDLAAAGVPTVPTEYVPPGATTQAHWHDVVIKPSVSGSAADTGRFASVDASGAVALVRALHHQGRTAMVQPYLGGIEAEGETSMIFLGGRYSHAVQRQPLLRRAGVRQSVMVADVLATVAPIDPTTDQLALAGAAVDAVPGGREQLGYARVDVIPGPQGPVLLELEATDCFLFLDFADQAARHRLAAAVLR